MGTIYIYLFRSSYSEEHINFMVKMLTALEYSNELAIINTNERPELNALELEVSANSWAASFLAHMSKCDMLYGTYVPIIES